MPLAFGAAAALGAIVLLVLFAQGGLRASVAAATAPEPTDECRATPTFTADPALISAGGSGLLRLSTEGRERGLALSVEGATGAPYQHHSWDDAGYLGAIAYDSGGNIYAAPTPRLSLADNPLSGATTLWRVDSVTAEMRPFVTLPGVATERNPFGVLGLFYACDLDMLYAGNVIGSTSSSERGGVVALRLPDGLPSPVVENLDVMGVLVVRQGESLMLYAGLARSPEIVAVRLDKDGRAAGPVTPLLDLTLAGAGPQERARKLRLVNGLLVADLVPFAYSLQSSVSGTPQLRRATWSWDGAAGDWVLHEPASSPVGGG